MKNDSNIFKRLCIAVLPLLAVLLLQSCDENKSYSEMLETETKSVNWYLSHSRVETAVPEDSVFEVGPDAPFYRMNYDGTVYMRVLNIGDMSRRPKKGDMVYFLYMRSNINTMHSSDNMAGKWEGNAQNMNSQLNGTNFIFGNTALTSTTQYGTGLQVPLNYLGYDCEVDLVVKSIEGLSGDISQCIPYVYNIRYFKAEY